MAVLTPPDAPPSGGSTQTAETVAPNPFTRASRKRVEPFMDVTRALTASAQTMQQEDVPATGYLRHLVIDVDLSGTTGATYNDDAPFNVLDSVMLADVNGQPLVLLSGWQLFLADMFGGYSWHGDVRDYPGYTLGATGASFQLRIPLEIVQRNALGALQNLNAAMTYKLKVTVAPIDEVYATNGTGATVRIQGHVESWANPLGADVRGVPNITTPPALGTTQNWSVYTHPITNGQNTIRLPRVGNTIRNLIFEFRDTTGARTDSGIPSELSTFVDGNQWRRNSWGYELQRLYELYGYGSADRPAGVWVHPLTDDFDGAPGEEIGDYWLPTTGATRLELQATFTAAGSLTIITNDILAWQGSGGAGQTLGS